eukprot:TRINITY_DN2476_c0_g4_i6.p1 TRINITY_DN2476_c0_g4~~TRINITY_DN2476_c0_g4_i6.p1  ORF type:complete len:185 (-),score=-18.08 TRINITY_DN2476_c0_g4_i6:83-637(-)
MRKLLFESLPTLFIAIAVLVFLVCQPSLSHITLTVAIFYFCPHIFNQNLSYNVRNFLYACIVLQVKFQVYIILFHCCMLRSNYSSHHQCVISNFRNKISQQCFKFEFWNKHGLKIFADEILNLLKQFLQAFEQEFYFLNMIHIYQCQPVVARNFNQQFLLEKFGYSIAICLCIIFFSPNQLFNK